MEDREGTWDKIKGKTNDAVGGARGDLGQQAKGKAQQAVGKGKEILGRSRRDADEPR